MQNNLEFEKVLPKLEKEVNQLKGMSVKTKSLHQKKKIYRDLLRAEEEKRIKEKEKLLDK